MKKKGFTLIELIVVIAIIGVLAAVLVPSLLGYVRKARRSVDINSAKEVYYNVMDLLATDDVAYASFYAQGSSYRDSGAHTATDPNTGDDYKIVWVAKIDGNKTVTKAAAWVWTPIDSPQHDDFALAMNNKYGYGTNSSERYIHLPIKLGSKDENNKTINRWFIGYRKGDPEQIEIWVVDAGYTGVYSGTPIACVYPYTSANFR